jgi:hypothetical protein
MAGKADTTRVRLIQGTDAGDCRAHSVQGTRTKGQTKSNPTKSVVPSGYVSSVSEFLAHALKRSWAFVSAQLRTKHFGHNTP